jgi:hypothetical protein
MFMEIQDSIETARGFTLPEEENVSRPVTVSIPHKLGRDEARRRLEEGFGRLRRQMTGGIGGMLACHER